MRRKTAECLHALGKAVLLIEKMLPDHDESGLRPVAEAALLELRCIMLSFLVDDFDELRERAGNLRKVARLVRKMTRFSRLQRTN